MRVCHRRLSRRHASTSAAASPRPLQLHVYTEAAAASFRPDAQPREEARRALLAEVEWCRLRADCTLRLDDDVLQVCCSCPRPKQP